MVVAVGAGMVRGEPTPMGVPPQELVYQWIVPPTPPDALSVIVGGMELSQ